MWKDASAKTRSSWKKDKYGRGTLTWTLGDRRENRNSRDSSFYYGTPRSRFISIKFHGRTAPQRHRQVGNVLRATSALIFPILGHNDVTRSIPRSFLVCDSLNSRL